ncbi:MAG TPA: hypothetical protein VFV59_00770 [Candidatus Limnocylindria bacterium]|nr:hypothetical protein [Candidatus Limnocylindria bacterium]
MAPDGPWIGFAPALDDTYVLVIGGAGASRREPADADDLLSLALAYFEDGLEAPPEELAATHADIGALVRHLVEVETDASRRASLTEAVDAIDDGLAPDVVVGRLVACLNGEEEAVARLSRRAAAALGGS